MKCYVLCQLSFLVFTIGVLEMPLWSSDYNTFVDCVQANTTSYTTCTLDASSYPYFVYSTIYVGGSSKVISGGSTDPGQTVLQRNGYFSSIFQLGPNAQDVTFEYLTIDGNRWTYPVSSAIDIDLTPYQNTFNIGVVDTHFKESPWY